MATRGRPPAQITLTGIERRQLQSWARRHSSAQALAMRRKIILLCEDSSLTGKAVAAKVVCNPATVSKWRKRVATLRLDGLIDEPRPRAQQTISDETVEQVMIDTLETTPKDATHSRHAPWPHVTGSPARRVPEIWRAFGLRRWEIDEFKISPDPPARRQDPRHRPAIPRSASTSHAHGPITTRCPSVTVVNLVKLR